MSKEKVKFEQFLEAVDTENIAFIEELHDYLLINGCKATFEEAKMGFVASYKHGKPPRVLLNIVFRKQGMFARIYGSRVNDYIDFLDTLPKVMLDSIESAGICRRLVHNTCSPKCSGYDFMIGEKHMQKCVYNCFFFYFNSGNNPYIKGFVEHELRERMG
jgi:hypothetical protein